MLSDKIKHLYTLCHDLLYLGMDGSPVYTCDLTRLNREVFTLCNELYEGGFRGATAEEEALLCLSLLKGYEATCYDYGDKQRRLQSVLDRCRSVLRVLPPSLLRVSLLAWCYNETFDESLAQEARSIISTWGNPALFTPEQREIVDELSNFEENQEGWEEVDE